MVVPFEPASFRPQPPINIPAAAATFLALNAAWELAQLPLYTLWVDESRSAIAFALIHCTFGDLLIGVCSFILAWSTTRLFAPANSARFYLFPIVFVAIGMGYTVFSEWLNVQVRRSWAYSDYMPTIPPLGTGLSPLLQWLIVPVVTFYLTRARANET